MLSPLPLPETPAKVPIPDETILLLNMLNSLPVTSEHVRQWTSFIESQNHGTAGLADLYQRRKDELGVHDGRLLWGTRIVVPPLVVTRLPVRDTLESPI